MNKYKKALKTFGNVPFMIGHFRVFEKSDEDVEKDYKLLQELVDKETPKKVLKNTNYDNCPVCYMSLADYDKDDVTAVYCKYCGQRLDSKNE